MKQSSFGNASQAANACTLISGSAALLGCASTSTTSPMAKVALHYVLPIERAALPLWTRSSRFPRRDLRAKQNICGCSPACLWSATVTDVLGQSLFESGVKARG